MKLLRELFHLLTHHAFPANSHGHALTRHLQVLSAQTLPSGLEILLRLPPASLPVNEDGFAQRTALCTILDLSTSVAAWMSSPHQHISLSVGMDFAFLRDIDFDRELIVKATCLDRNKAVAHTMAEVRQEELVATMHHTVFYMNETVKEVFRLSD